MTKYIVAFEVELPNADFELSAIKHMMKAYLVNGAMVTVHQDPDQQQVSLNSEFNILAVKEKDDEIVKNVCDSMGV